MSAQGTGCSSWSSTPGIHGSCPLPELLGSRPFVLLESQGLWLYSDHTEDSALDRLLVSPSPPSQVDAFEFARFVPPDSSLFIGRASEERYRVSVDSDAQQRSLLDQLVRVSTPEREVAVVLASGGYVDLLANFLCSARALGRRNILVVSASRTVLSLAIASGIGYTTPLPSQYAGAGSASFGSVAYQELMLFRTQVVTLVLQLDFRPIVADIDTVWLSDPWVSWRGRRDFDLLVTDDGGEVCGCFVYLNSTPGAMSLWNELLRSHQAMVDEATSSGRLASFADSEQKILTRLIYGREFRGDLRVFVLPKESFPSGYDFFGEFASKNTSPVVVHNNFIIGKETKINRFQRYGLWYLSHGSSHSQGYVECSDGITKGWVQAFASSLKDLRLPVQFAVSPVHNSISSSSSILVQVINERTPQATSASKLWFKVDPPTYLPFDHHAIYELHPVGIDRVHFFVSSDFFRTNSYVSVGINNSVFAMDRGSILSKS